MKQFVTRIRQISMKPFPFKQRRHALKKSASKLHISFPFVLTRIVYEGICPGIRDYQPHKQERCRLMKINNKLTDGTNSTAWLIVQSEHTCRASLIRNDQSRGIFQASARSLSNPTWTFRQCLQKGRKQMVSAEREAMMGWTEGIGVAAWVTEWRPIAAFAVSGADLGKARFDNNGNVWKRWAVLSWSSHAVCWSFPAHRWYTSPLMMILVSSGVNECRPAHGNVTPWHYSCSVFPFCSVFISTSLLMLFQVFYLYSITTKVYSSPETAGLAPCYVFLLSLLLIPFTPLPPPSVMCFRLFLKSHSGTAGRQSSLVIHGADFSTKDMDNDNCMCKCALMLTGGECSRIRLNLCWGATRGTSRAFPTPRRTRFSLGW